jgi:hypothetical protein
MEEELRYWTIPRLAKRLGVTPTSVRDWIARGLIEEPSTLPVTGERAYAAAAAERIERWYLRRAAAGKTRGPGSRDRRERARKQLAETGSA